MKELVFDLCSADFIGGVTDANSAVIKYMKPLADEICTDKTGGVFAKINGKNSYTVMVQAHIDRIGAVVTNICENGFVKCNAVGGLDIRVLPSQKVIIHAKDRNICGVFTSVPPHLAKGNEDKFLKTDELFIDTLLDDAKEIISVGDYITFDTVPTTLANGFVSSKALDNMSGCAAIIRTAQLVSMNKNVDCNVVFCFSSGEELGNRGAAPNAFEIAPNEAVAVDVSFGISPQSPPEHCGKCSCGTMIGISPVLCKEMSERLCEKAKEKNIAYQTEVMGGRTSTDADAISISKSGVKTALLSIPLRYMHTPVETVDLKDIESTAQLIYEYLTEVCGK